MNPNLQPLQFNYIADDPDFHEIKAKNNEGSEIGRLSWAKPGVNDGWMVSPGEVKNVFVHPDHRGKGIASQLWNLAKAQDPSIRHSSQQTDAGRGWAQRVGD